MKFIRFIALGIIGIVILFLVLNIVLMIFGIGGDGDSVLGTLFKFSVKLLFADLLLWGLTELFVYIIKSLINIPNEFAEIRRKDVEIKKDMKDAWNDLTDSVANTDYQKKLEFFDTKLGKQVLKEVDKSIRKKK